MMAKDRRMEGGKEIEREMESGDVRRVREGQRQMKRDEGERREERK